MEGPVLNGIAGPLLNWTPAGLVYSKTIGFRDVFTMPIDPSTGRAAGPPVQIAYPETGSNGGNFGLAWSPDGSRLAFFKQDRSVVVTSAEGRDALEFEMPPKTGYAQRLRWLPDGCGLSYVSPNDREVATLFRVMLDTGAWESDPFPVAFPEQRPYDWSRDGRSIYYSSAGDLGPSWITEHELASGRERPPGRAGSHSMDVEALGWQGARREHTGSIRPTSNAARRDGSAARNVKLFLTGP